MRRKEGANQGHGPQPSNGEPFLLEQSRPWQRKEEKKDQK